MRSSRALIGFAFIGVALAGWWLILARPERAPVSADPEPEAELEAPPIRRTQSPSPPPAPATVAAKPARAAEPVVEPAPVADPEPAVPAPTGDWAQMTPRQRHSALRESLRIPPHLQDATDEEQRKHFEVLLNFQEAMSDRARDTLATLARADQRDPEVQQQREETLRQLEIFKQTTEVIKERLARWPDW